MTDRAAQLLPRIRLLLAIVIGGLVISGVTAFPLLSEVDLLHRWLVDSALPLPLTTWLGKVHEGLSATQHAYPFLAYGTDWLAFGHLVIALFFIGPYLDPVRNIWVIRAGQIACLLVIPTALICGQIRGIPLWWRAIDSAFGVFGFIPLWLAYRLTRQLEQVRPNGTQLSAKIS